MTIAAATSFLAAISLSNPWEAIKSIAGLAILVMLIWSVPNGTAIVMDGISKVRQGEQGWMGIISGLGLAAAPLLVYAIYGAVWPDAVVDLSTITDQMNGN